MKPVAFLGNKMTQCINIILMGWASETKTWVFKVMETLYFCCISVYEGQRFLFLQVVFTSFTRNMIDNIQAGGDSVFM